MATIKSYTDLNQSKVLSKILPLKSADMYYPSEVVLPKFGVALSISNNIPCWSLASLLSVLPKYEIYNNGKTIQLDVNREALATEGDETLLDLVVNMIIHLHELNLL